MNITGLVRVTVAAPQRRLDLALPEQSSVAEIIPGLLTKAGEHLADEGIPNGGWTIRRQDGTELTLGRTLGSHRIKDGEILHLVPRQLDWPELEYDDLVDAVATSSRRLGAPWSSWHTRAAGLSAATVATGVALTTVLRAGAPWHEPAGWLLLIACILVVGAVVLARVIGDAGAGALAGGLSLPFAALGGGLLLAGDNGMPAVGAPQVLTGSAALLLVAVACYLGVVESATLFVAATSIGLLGVAGGWIGTSNALDGADVAAIVGPALLAFSPFLASSALRLGRLPMPILPRNTSDLVRDDPQPPRRQVYGAVIRADGLLTGMLTGVMVAVSTCQVLLIGNGTRSATILTGLLAIGALLRSRLYPIVKQRLMLLVPGLVGGAALALGPLSATVADPVPTVVLLMLLAGVLAIFLGLRYSTRHANPLLARSAEILEILVVLGLIPVTCAVLGLYGVVRGMGWLTVATKKDQLQSHQFLVQRMVSALVVRESDPEQPPFKRPVGAAIGSVALAVLALVVVGVYGLVVPGGNKAWQSGDAVIVEKETGTRYVYVDGRLHPVTNYASALLALGKYGQTRSVSRRSLTAAARGPRIGIPDAPDALPATNRLLSSAWTLCSEPSEDLTGARTSESVLMVGRQPSTGRQMTDEAMLVEVIETGDQYLLWHGYRHRIQKADVVTVGLALGSEPWAKVGAAFVAGLPDGQPIAPLKQTGVGLPSKALTDRPATLVGQLFVVRSGGGVQHYVAGKDRLLPISELQFDIQRAYAPVAAAYRGKAPYGIPLGLLSAGQAQPPSTQVRAGQAPRSRPEFVAPRDGLGTVCATFSPGAGLPEISIDPAMPPRDPDLMTAKRNNLGTALADRVVVPPGTAALVEAMPSGKAAAGTILVVTDMGRSYPLSEAKVAEMLGYEGVQPIRIPAGLVARIPQGPGLNPAAATKQAD